MMGKYEIATAAMNIDSLPQMRANHRRALKVPTRSPAAPGTVPTGLLIARGLPKHKITGMALVIGHFDPRACHHVLKLPPTELTIGGHGFNREQSVAISLIRVSVGDQSLRQRNHVLDVLRGHWLDAG